jgi:GNAT superfamily N-acetyltransferase
MIRTATREDVPTILRFVHELAAYEKAPEEVKAVEADFERDLFGPTPAASVLIAEDGDGNAVGFALWFTTYSTWLGKAGIYLEDLYVSPAARGGGHGRALLTELARIAVERGYGRVEWSVLDWNAPAIGFYKSLGAAPQDEWTVYRLTGDALAALGSA